MSDSPFVRLASINVSEHIEKKAGLSYLSWPWAVDRLLREDPQANWEFHEPQFFADTMMVSCTVTAFGTPRKMHLPVMDHRNKAIVNPNAFDINKNMMRCLVKAIALHGLGLYIYAGEDLPEGEPEKPKQKATPNAGAGDAVSDERKAVIGRTAVYVADHLAKGDDDGAYDAANEFSDIEEKRYLWALLDSKQRAILTDVGNRRRSSTKKEDSNNG